MDTGALPLSTSSRKKRSQKKKIIGEEERSDNRFLFLFNRRHDGTYILFKIDVLDCYRNRLENIPLSPLVVFSNEALSADVNFAFAYIKPYFYVIGSNNQVFTIKKSQLLNTDNSETKRGHEFLNHITPMYGDKSVPLAFTHKNKLFVISKAYRTIYEQIQQIGSSFHDFEVYSPKDRTWTCLDNSPLRHVAIKSYLIHDDMLYFTTSIDVVLSFILTGNTWLSIIDPYHVLNRSPESPVHPRPTFDTQVQIIGDKIFGGIYRFGYSFFDVVASSVLDPNHIMFMRPNLTHDKDLYEHIYSVPNDICHSLSDFSKSIVTIDASQEIMCIVGYGNNPYDELSNYATLTFFMVSGDSYKGDMLLIPELEGTNEVVPIPFSWNNQFSYASDEDQMHVNFFRADFLSSCFMPIDTKEEVTPGFIYGSLLV